MPEDPKDLMRRFYDAVSTGDLDALDELVADDVVDHEEFPGMPPGKEGVRQFFGMLRSAFPDLQMEPHEMVAEGDLVCARVTITGTQDGDWMGMPPSGRRIEVEALDMVRLRDGLAVEHWGSSTT